MEKQPEAFTSYVLEQSTPQTVSRSFFAQVFLWMGGALAISAFFAFLFASNRYLLSYLITTNKSLTFLGMLTMFAPLIFVIAISRGYQRFSAPVMAALFVAYAAINGISLSFILLKYANSSVFGCFLSAALMFGIMAVMGYTTKKDLTSFGRIMKMGLIGIVIAVLVNLFLKSDGLSYMISMVGVAVFTGLTAYDVQKLKQISMTIEGNGNTAGVVTKTALLGALNLYLDFINLFLMLLSLFGNRK
jgi:FtsH-binding integral membrane protein